MKQYLLSVIEPTGDELPPPDFLEKVMRDVRAVNAEIKAAGAWVFAGGLYPPGTATVVRPRDSEFLMTDGPFAEGKEHIGGFVIVKARDLDDALHWARKVARATTFPIEVRPFREQGVE